MLVHIALQGDLLVCRVIVNDIGVALACSVHHISDCIVFEALYSPVPASAILVDAKFAFQRCLSPPFRMSRLCAVGALSFQGAAVEKVSVEWMQGQMHG